MTRVFSYWSSEYHFFAGTNMGLGRCENAKIWLIGNEFMFIHDWGTS